MQHHKVQSSNVQDIGYDETKQILEVAFNNGTVYQYSGVPSAIFDYFMKADSKGRYLNTEIKGKYEFKQIT